MYNVTVLSYHLPPAWERKLRMDGREMLIERNTKHTSQDSNPSP